MGCWGMGITQSDEYCEIYERFMEEYDEGKPLSDIKTDILDEYLEEFDENDGVLHDVYFAIGKGEWMCGGISDEMFEIISSIIKLGKNITFYRELEATESDLKLRQRNLEKFLTALSTPRGKVKKLYEQIPTIDNLINEHILPLGYFTVETFPNMEKLNFVGNNPDFKKLDITYPYFVFEQWKPATFAIAKEENLVEDYPLDLCVKFTDCIKRIEELKAAINAN